MYSTCMLRLLPKKNLDRGQPHSLRKDCWVSYNNHSRTKWGVRPEWGKGQGKVQAKCDPASETKGGPGPPWEITGKELPLERREWD